MKTILFGLGAIGSNLFVQLVKQYPEWSFVGVDFDHVEDRNLRTQIYFREHVGYPKASALLQVGIRYVQKLKYISFLKKIDAKTKPIDQLQSNPGDLWIDCFDNTESRKALKAIVPQGVHLLHLGFSPLYSAECLWDEQYDVPGDVDPKQPDICAMVDAVGFIQMFVGLVVLNLSDWVQTGKKKDFLITNKTSLKKL